MYRRTRPTIHNLVHNFACKHPPTEEVSSSDRTYIPHTTHTHLFEQQKQSEKACFRRK